MSKILPENSLRKLFESVPGEYLVVTPDFKIVAMTDSYSILTGIDKEKAINKNIFEIFPMEKNNNVIQLEKAKAINDAVLASIGECLVVIDKQGCIVYVNESFEKVSGWKSDEVLGKVFVEAIPCETEQGEKVANHNRLITKVLNGENPEENHLDTVYYLCKDGTRFPVSSLVKRIILNSEVIGAVKTFRDITKAKDIDQAKTEFVSLASHQLRTPLSTINWYSEMLLDGDAGEINEKQKKYLDQIYKANQRMIGMVKSFLNVSRIELGTLTMDKAPTDIVGLINDVVDEQTKKIIDKGISFEFKHGENFPLISLDSKRIRMALQNLLGNAIKYTRENGNITIIAELTDDKKNIQLKFIDDGIGIPKDAHLKIFNKLFRADNVVEYDTEGNGLGLYLVKNIVDTSGGKIWFESEVDKGTVFYISLPL